MAAPRPAALRHNGGETHFAMRILIDEPACEPPPELLIVLLTGTYSEPEDFVREGFPAAIRERGIAAEIVMVGTPPSQVADGTIAAGLREAIVKPAHARGRSRLWLAGISLGGLAALAYAARHEADLEGVVLLAPYPGTRDVIQEIDAAGGLARWRHAPAQTADAERDAWSWLAAGSERSAPAFLYYGKSDRFAAGQRRMGEALPAHHVRQVAGAHDWATWRRLWDLFLDEHAADLDRAPAAENLIRSRSSVFQERQ